MNPLNAEFFYTPFVVRTENHHVFAASEDSDLEQKDFNGMEHSMRELMRFFAPLVRISSPRRVDPSDRRTDAW